MAQGPPPHFYRGSGRHTRPGQSHLSPAAPSPAPSWGRAGAPPRWGGGGGEACSRAVSADRCGGSWLSSVLSAWWGGVVDPTRIPDPSGVLGLGTHGKLSPRSLTAFSCCGPRARSSERQSSRYHTPILQTGKVETWALGGRMSQDGLERARRRGAYGHLGSAPPPFAENKYGSWALQFMQQRPGGRPFPREPWG